MSYNPVVAELARALSPNPNPHGPRPPMPVTGIATLQSVDPYSASTTVTVNGGSIVIPGIRYMHAYSDANQPRAGHEAVIHISGAGQVFLMGHHAQLQALQLGILP